MKNNGSVYLPELAKIVSSRRLTDMEKYFELSFKDQNGFKFTPGQFVQLSVFGIGEAPISISSSPFKDDTFGVCIRQGYLMK